MAEDEQVACQRSPTEISPFPVKTPWPRRFPAGQGHPPAVPCWKLGPASAGESPSIGAQVLPPGPRASARGARALGPRVLESSPVTPWPEEAGPEADDKRATWAMHEAARGALVAATKLLEEAGGAVDRGEGDRDGVLAARGSTERPIGDVDLRIRLQCAREARWDSWTRRHRGANQSHPQMSLNRRHSFIERPQLRPYGLTRHILTQAVDLVLDFVETAS